MNANRQYRYSAVSRVSSGLPGVVLAIVAMLVVTMKALAAPPAADPAQVTLPSEIAGPTLASGQPDFLVEILDEIVSPDNRDGIQTAHVADLTAIVSAAESSRRTVTIDYRVIRENDELAASAGITVLPFTDQSPVAVNPDDFVNLDALQAAIDRHDEAARQFKDRLAAHHRLREGQAQAFVRQALATVQFRARSAREALAARTKGEIEASDVAGALKGAAVRARAICPKFGTIVIINSSLTDSVAFRWDRSSLKESDFPGPIRLVIAVNTSFRPDRSGFLHSSRLEIHHRNSLGEAAVLLGDLLNR